MTSNRSKPFDRDALLRLAAEGKITGEEAEAKAIKAGSPPFTWQPPLPAFDPMQEAQWSFVMAIAWIAWRDLAAVREQDARFRAECRHFLFQKSKKPRAKIARSGFFLEPWSKTSVSSLRLLEVILESRDKLPPTRQMPVKIAEHTLWRALSEGRLTGHALIAAGVPIDIPERDWSYLQLAKVQDADVLRYISQRRRWAGFYSGEVRSAEPASLVAVDHPSTCRVGRPHSHRRGDDRAIGV